jgi:surface protein
MSIRNVQQNSINQRHMNAPRPIVRVPSTAGFQSGTGQWVRNPSWLALPSITDTDQKLVGLYAVFPSGGNFIALTASAAYTVDWGDGTAPVNVAAGVQAQHEYDWADVDLDGTDAPVTFTASTDTVNRTAHGFIDGQIVSFATIATTTGITVDTPYFVVNAAADTFQLSATSGGSAIALTNDGTGTLLPYKQAIVTVTPQAGENLTALNLNVRFSTLPARAYATGWLDLAISGPNFSASGLVVGGVTVEHAYLERAHLLNIGNCTSMASMFQDCRSLQSVPLFNTAAVTSMQSMFFGCFSLQSVPLFNTAAVTSMASMLRDCVSLQSVPLFNTAAVTSMESMFSFCLSLQSVSLFNTAAVTIMASMFRDCRSLQSVPLFNTAAVTNMQGMLQDCFSLQSVPLFNTAAVTNMQGMFQDCRSLQSVPLFNTAAVTNMTTMFGGCFSLQSVPLFNTAAVTNMQNMLQDCRSLQSVPLFNTAAVTNMQNMFFNCFSLQSVPLFNTAAVTNMTNMFSVCFSLQSVPLFNTAAVTSMQSMFFGCFSLQSVPLFNTAAVTNMTTMLRDCFSLQSVPLFNTAAATSMQGMFQDCRSLQSVPLFNTAAVTNMTNMFFNCVSLQSVPALNTSTVSSSANFNNMFLNSRSLSRIEAKEFNFTFSVANCKLSVTALDEIFTNLPKVTTTQTITVTGNYGAATVSKTSSGTTSGSATVTIANTADLTTGMEISGVGISDAVAVTMQDSGDTVTRTAHGIPNDTPVSFATIVTTTGIATYTTYYVVNAAADTFQVADTIGGSPRTLTTDGTGTLLYGTTITAITPNVDVTLSIPASATGSVTTVSGNAKFSIARLKNWAVTG